MAQIHGLTFNTEQHRYAAQGRDVPGVTMILHDLGFYPPYPMDPYYRARGAAVHSCTELIDQGMLAIADNREGQTRYPGTDERLWGYLDGWREFRAATMWVIRAVEERISHDGLWYAGTLDRRFISSASNIIADIKTGSAEEFVRYQLAGYALGCGDLKARRVVIELPGDGRYHLRDDFSCPQDIDDWATIAKFWHLQKRRS